MCVVWSSEVRISLYCTDTRIVFDIELLCVQLSIQEGHWLLIPHRGLAEEIGSVRQHSACALSAFCCCYRWIVTDSSSHQVAPSADQQPDVDLIVVRENTECLVGLIIWTNTATSFDV